MLPVLLFLLSILFACVTPVMAIIFVVRWIRRRKKWPFAIIACVCAILCVAALIGIGPAYLNSMTPEERAAYEESIAAEESRREESRLAEESRKEESRKEEESRQAEIANCTHNWGSGEITTQSTCEKDGVRTYTCSKCNTTKTETIKAAGHKYTKVEESADLNDNEITIKLECSCGKTKTEEKDMSTEEMAAYLKENCKTYEYEEIARYPDKHKGELTTFTGEVLQVQKSIGEYILLVNITKVGDKYYSYYTDTIYVTYKFTDGLKVLEGDIITMYGKSTGEHTYFSVLGQLITVPSFTAYYAELGEASDDKIANPDDFDEDKVVAQLDVKTYKQIGKWSSDAFVEITNNSEYDLQLEVDLKFYDDSNKLVGADSRTLYAVQSGTTAFLFAMLDEEFATIEYEISASEETWYDCVVNDLTCEVTSAKQKEIVTITNNGDLAAELVECYVLFFKGEEVVDFAFNYFIDDDGELKPGKSKTCEMSCYEDYDSYKIYIMGIR